MRVFTSVISVFHWQYVHRRVYQKIDASTCLRNTAWLLFWNAIGIRFGRFGNVLRRHLNWNKSRKRGNQKKDRASSYYAKECIYIINFQKDRTMKLRARRFHFWPVTKFFRLDYKINCWVIFCKMLGYFFFFLIIRIFLSLGLWNKLENIGSV